MSQDPRWTADTEVAITGVIRNSENGSCSCNACTARAVLAALDEAGLLVPAGGETRREGICGAEAPKLFVNCAKTLHVICVLSHGHGSAWHEGDTGERWRPRRDVEVFTGGDLATNLSPECMSGGLLHADCDNDLGCECECHKAEARGYQQAITELDGVFVRTGSPAARWAAGYLTDLAKERTQ